MAFSSTLPSERKSELLGILKKRFEKNKHRHVGLVWEKIEGKLESNPKKLWSLNEMEYTEGEPDVVGYDNTMDEYIFYDCAPESPKGRRSVCYDDEALESRKEFKPKASAVGMATEMGIELLTEAEYRRLQEFGKLDTKTSSWLATPDSIRK